MLKKLVVSAAIIIAIVMNFSGRFDFNLNIDIKEIDRIGAMVTGAIIMMVVSFMFDTMRARHKAKAMRRKQEMEELAVSHARAVITGKYEYIILPQLRKSKKNNRPNSISGDEAAKRQERRAAAMKQYGWRAMDDIVEARRQAGLSGGDKIGRVA